MPERRRKKEAREHKLIAKKAKTLKGLKAKIFNKERYKEKVRMHKLIKAHEEKDAEVKKPAENKEGSALPTYLLDREKTENSKVLSNMIK